MVHLDLDIPVAADAVDAGRSWHHVHRVADCGSPAGNTDSQDLADRHNLENLVVGLHCPWH